MPSFRLSVFLQRFFKGRGFGIQSPTDFAFVNEVIYERMPYAAYNDLEVEYEDVGWFTRKILKVFFRISNFVQAEHYIFAEDTDEATKAYIKRGCQLAKTGRTFYYDIIPESPLNDGDCIVISDIYGKQKTKWDALLSQREQSHLVIFDFYYFGIAFVRQNRYSESYIVNFY